MKSLNILTISLVISFFTISCSCGSNDKSQIIFPEIGNIAKEHAMQLSNNNNLSGMETQQILFEVRAHEQQLREAGMNDEANYYVGAFLVYLDSINPTLAKEIQNK